MHKDKFVFAQMVEFLNSFKFLRIVKKYDGNRYVKHFTCLESALDLDVWAALQSRKSA